MRARPRDSRSALGVPDAVRRVGGKYRGKCRETGRRARAGALPVAVERAAPAIAAHAMGALEEVLVLVRRPAEGARRDETDARGSAPDGASILGVGAAALLRLSVSVPARCDLQARAAGPARTARAARSAHQGCVVP